LLARRAVVSAVAAGLACEGCLTYDRATPPTDGYVVVRLVVRQSTPSFTRVPRRLDDKTSTEPRPLAAGPRSRPEVEPINLREERCTATPWRLAAVPGSDTRSAQRGMCSVFIFIYFYLFIYLLCVYVSREA